MPFIKKLFQIKYIAFLIEKKGLIFNYHNHDFFTLCFIYDRLDLTLITI